MPSLRWSKRVHSPPFGDSLLDAGEFGVYICACRLCCCQRARFSPDEQERGHFLPRGLKHAAKKQFKVEHDLPEYSSWKLRFRQPPCRHSHHYPEKTLLHSANSSKHSGSHADRVPAPIDFQCSTSACRCPALDLLQLGQRGLDLLVFREALAFGGALAEAPLHFHLRIRSSSEPK